MNEYEKSKLYKIRHSAEHVFNQAVEELWPGKVTRAVGPAIAEGFYNDSRWEQPISEEDFPKIEKRMQEIITKDLPFVKKVISEKEAREMFKNNPFKQEFIDDFAKEGNEMSVYYTGDPEKKENVFVDLCRGPHVESTGEIKAFKLLSIAGAYWKGSEKNEMLTRVYGTAFESGKELKEYLEMLEEAKKRDHRKLGQELDLFHFSEKVGKGLPLWTPKGTIIREELENWAKETEKNLGYKRVASAHIGKEELYLTSGHLPYYKDDMYPPMEIEGENYFLKGMNCPHHFELYNRSQHSYKELPLRYAEYGTVYRYEMSGSLFGLMRVRSMAQNDAHIFCTQEQAEEEFLNVLNLHEHYYNTLGLSRNDYHIVIGLPDEKKRDKYHGDKDLWAKAEEMMRNAIKKSGIKCIDDVGGAAFYGPKIDFNIKSAIGRTFSISTNQLDLFMPKRFNLEYITESGEKDTVVVIHRAPLGSHERFIGFLIEHFGGAFPVWLSPVQVEIIAINDKVLDYAKSVKEKLEDSEVRVETDDRDETMQNKIRKAQEQKIPYMLIIGDKEKAENKVSMRTRKGNQYNLISLENFKDTVVKIINSKSLDSWK